MRYDCDLPLNGMKKPYLKKFTTVDGFTVWIVDGPYIRTHIDEEFTNFGQHYRFKFIPKKELWIDHEHAFGEIEYFIDHLLVEYRLMAEGKSYKRALAAADKKEKRERRIVDIAKRHFELLRNPEQKDTLFKKIHKQLLKKYSKGGIEVWIVDGDLVRDFFFIDFTEGGHDKVYPFIPFGEMWIDDDIFPKERKFVILHELTERNKMFEGFAYPRAHREASRVEYAARNKPAETDAEIVKALEKAVI